MFDRNALEYVLALARQGRTAPAARVLKVDPTTVQRRIGESTRIWRVLASPEQRHTARVAAFFDFIVDDTDALRPILTG